jgi:hypothetical protein
VSQDNEPKPKRVVLIVDDEPMVASILSKLCILIGLGEPRVARTLEDALALATEAMTQKWEVVASIVDLRMPDGRPDQAPAGRRPLLVMLRELDMHPALFSGYLSDGYVPPDGVPVFSKGTGLAELGEWLRGRLVESAYSPA